MRSVEWDETNHNLKMIDQRLLPAELRFVHYDTPQEVAIAIQEMVVRGAPAIGVAAAFGVALAAQNSQALNKEDFIHDLQEAAEILQAARPTAINLKWAVQSVLNTVKHSAAPVSELKKLTLKKAQQMADEDVAINQRMAQHGANLINEGDTVIHHCNTGALATVDWGTALGVIRFAHESGKHIHVLVDETRPRLQGSRLTAWELQQYGIPFDIISDNAAGYFLQTGQAQKVLFGADRMAANGDVANKIGSYMLALAAHDNDTPVYTVLPTSTIDMTLTHGGLIPIEERAPEEVLGIQFQGQMVSPIGATARNPAFDVTPARLLTGIVTENGVVYPPFEINLPKVIQGDQLWRLAR